MKHLDWNLVRAFHATASSGSLSAAAEQIGLTQPTLSRQVAALETELGVALFDRTGRRLMLSDAGRRLLKHTEEMHSSAASIALAVMEQEQAIEGRITISASDSFSQYLLPGIVERVRGLAPQLSVFIMVSNEISDLHRGEADIAVRHARPDRKGLAGRYIGTCEVDFYAAEAWVAEHGIPKSYQDLTAQWLIGFGDPVPYAEYLRRIGFLVGSEDFHLASESSVVIWEMVKRGMGVAPIHRAIAERIPGIVRLFPGNSPIHSPLWIVTHETLQESPKVRLVQRILEEALLEVLS